MPPANDAYANRVTLTGTSGTWTGNSDTATSEAGEPAPFAGTGGASIWFEWTPGFTGLAQIDTIGSTYTGTSTPLDTVIDAFTGSTLAGLALVDGNDDDPSGLNSFNSRLRVPVTSGTTYIIRVDGFSSSDTGDIALQWAHHLEPNITGFDPPSFSVAPSDPLTILGSNFTGTTAVTFDGSSVSFTVTDDGHVQITVPGGASLNTDYVIAVTNAAGTDSAVIHTASAPAVTGVTPTHAPPGALVTVAGTLLASVDEVRFQVGFGGGATVVSVSPASTATHAVTAVVPYMAAGAGLVELYQATVFVGNAAFTVDTLPAPTVTGVTPARPPAGGTVTITGTHLGTATAVTFTQSGSSSISFTVVDDDHLDVTVPGGATAGASATLTVTTPAGSAGGSFTVAWPAPVITSFTPDHGSAGTVITITGSGFTPTTDVRLGGIILGFTVVDDMTIEAAIPAGGDLATTTVPKADADLPITVANPDAADTTTALFTVFPMLAVVATAIASLAGWTATNFDGLTAVDSTRTVALTEDSGATAIAVIDHSDLTAVTAGAFAAVGIAYSSIDVAVSPDGSLVLLSGERAIGGTWARVYSLTGTTLTAASLQTWNVNTPPTPPDVQPGPDGAVFIDNSSARFRGQWTLSGLDHNHYTSWGVTSAGVGSLITDPVTPPADTHRVWTFGAGSTTIVESVSGTDLATLDTAHGLFPRPTGSPLGDYADTGTLFDYGLDGTDLAYVAAGVGSTLDANVITIAVADLTRDYLHRPNSVTALHAFVSAPQRRDTRDLGDGTLLALGWTSGGGVDVRRIEIGVWNPGAPTLDWSVGSIRIG